MTAVRIYLQHVLDLNSQLLIKSHIDVAPGKYIPACCTSTSALQRLCPASVIEEDDKLASFPAPFNAITWQPSPSCKLQCASVPVASCEQRSKASWLHEKTVQALLLMPSKEHRIR
eukprot:70798-Pelagomonas_calceolata.AAC.4